MAKDDDKKRVAKRENIEIIANILLSYIAKTKTLPEASVSQIIQE